MVEPIESMLTEIWCDVLGIEDVALDGDFFEHGGDSLMASRVVLAMTRKVGVKIPLRTFYAAATIEKLAETYRQALADAASPKVEREVGRL